MSLAIRLMPETVRTVAFGAIGAAYIGVGTSLSNPARIFILQNYTDVTLWFSFDGINDHLPLLSNTQLVLDIASNKTNPQGFFASQGQRIYVKQYDAAASSGAVHLSTFYGQEI